MLPNNPQSNASAAAALAQTLTTPQFGRAPGPSPRFATNLSQWRKPGFILIVLGICALQLQHVVLDTDWAPAGLVICFCGLAVLPGVRKTLRRPTEEIFADHFLVLVIAFLAYFVVGALLIPFGPAEQADYALSYYRIDAIEALRVTAVNAIGLGIALSLGSWITGASVAKLGLRAIGLGQAIAPDLVIIAFLLVGIVCTALVLPFDAGVREGIAPGLLRTLSQLLLVAILLAAAHSGRHSLWLLSVAIILTVVEAFLGLLLLNKSVVLLPIVALLTGLSWRFGVRRVMLPGFGVLLLAFVLIASPVTTARNIYGIGSKVEMGERTALLSGALLRRGETPGDRQSTTWARFCYLAVQGAALNFHDEGSPSESFRLLGWSFLPRILFPMKPIMSESGAIFHYQITGQTGSSAGAGVFVDGYYNWGWWGVMFVGFAVGTMLGTTSAVALLVYRKRALLWMPIALLGSFMAFRIDGDFLSDYWGPFVLFAYTLIMGAVLMESSRFGLVSSKLR